MMLTPHTASRLLLPLLGLAAFAVMGTEVAAVGIQRPVAAEFDVSTGMAGLLVTVYAAGVAIGGPLLAFALAGRPRRPTMAGLLVAFAATQGLAAVAPDLGLLLGARALAGIVGGAIFALLTVTAVGVAEPGREGRALATVALGLTLATVAGTPLSNAVGEQAGWRPVFWGIAAIALLVAVGLWASVPAGRPTEGSASWPRTLLRSGPARSGVLDTVLSTPATFYAYTYLTSLLADPTGLGETGTVVILAILGVAAAIGTTVGGRLLDRDAGRHLPALALGSATALAVLAAGAAVPVIVAVACAAFGFLAFALVPILQGRVIAAAGDTPLVAAAVNISAFNVANAVGAAIGGLAVGASGIRAPIAAAAALSLLAAIALRSRGARSNATACTRATGAGAGADLPAN